MGVLVSADDRGQHRRDAAPLRRGRGALIDRHHVTNVHLVPTQFHRLLGADDAAKARFSGKTLVAVWHGAAPCPPDVKRRMLEWWGDVVFEYYGSTEGSIVTTASPQEWRERPGTVGKATPMVDVRIVADDGTMAPPGVSGQIYVRNKMGTDFEYHKEPGKTADVHLEPGLFTFGDIGYVDADGYLFMSDRKIDMIISGGVNIYPAEIEAVLTTHPSVADAAVFGIPDDEFGEEVKAAIEVRPGIVADECARDCAHRALSRTPRGLQGAALDRLRRHNAAARDRQAL
jgi:long-chain acyl-CoA synthetase